jgi:hypothetical protein
MLKLWLAPVTTGNAPDGVMLPFDPAVAVIV